MKKNVFALSTLAVAALALFSCAKVETDVEIPEESKGIPFEIVASASQTKTVNNGLSTEWAEGDAVNVFHAVAGSTDYVNDGKFTATDAATGKFEGTLAEALDPETSYDWYVFYPYSSYITTPANTSSGYTTVAPFTQSQTENDSKAHLKNLPLAGKVTTSAGVSKPTVSMNQQTAVIKVVVTNNSGADLVVNQVKFTAPVNIAGTYYVDFTDPTNPGFTDKTGSVGTAVTLNTTVLSATSATSTYYLAVKPFTAANASTIKVKVNNYEKSLVLDADKTFAPGVIYPISFNYNEPASVATLPFSIDGTGGYAAYSSTTGMSSSGVTSNYAAANSPYLAKFDSNGDYVQVRFNEAAASASIGVKKIGGADNSSFDVMGSADGITFTKIETLNVTGATNAELALETTEAIDASYRYIRFVFNKSANVGVGPISISKPSTDPVIIASNVSDVPALGGSGMTLTYTINNFSGADDVAAAGDGTVVVADPVVSPAGTVTYTVNPNYGTDARNGSITLSSAAEGVNKEVTVSQLGETFSASATTITIPKDATTASFTITTPTFGWTAVANAVGEKNLTISGASSGSGNASAQTITVSSTEVAGAEEQELGTIVVYRNGNESDPQKQTITIKKASDAVTKYFRKVNTIASGKQYLIVKGGGAKALIPAVSGNKKSSADVVIDGENKIESSSYTSYAVTITKDGDYYKISFVDNKTTYYIVYGSSTNLNTTSSTTKKWTVQTTKSGSDPALRGTFRFVDSSSTNRGLIINSSNQWGGYAVSNVDGSSYWDIDLYELDD